MPGFHSFCSLFASFCIGQISHQLLSVRVKRGFCSKKEVTMHKHDQNDWHMSPLFGRTDWGGLIQLFTKEACYL